MRPWQEVWRKGYAKVFSTRALEELGTALHFNLPQLVQGVTTGPPPLPVNQDKPCEQADAIGYCGWIGEGLITVGQVEEFFAKSCFDVDQRLGEPAGCRWFLNWFDDTPRDEMRRELLAEIVRELDIRRGFPVAA